jgi:hypothetical protein
MITQKNSELTAAVRAVREIPGLQLLSFASTFAFAFGCFVVTHRKSRKALALCFAARSRQAEEHDMTPCFMSAYRVEAS